MKFSSSKSKKKKELLIYSPIDGKYKPISEVDDEVFSKNMIGEGIALIPSSEEVVSPINGKIELIYPTGHALVISDESTNIRILIHIGIDSIKLDSSFFKILVEKGQIISKGDKLLNIKLDDLKSIDIIILALKNSYTNFSYIKNDKLIKNEFIKNGSNIFKLESLD